MLEFVIWDVQHGSANYINTPNGRHMVIDLGTGTYGSAVPFSPLMYLKNGYGIQQLDFVLITHPHRDHLDDIFSFDALSPLVLHRPKHLTAWQIRQGNKEQDGAKIGEYLKIDARYNGQIAAGGMSDVSAINHWGGVKISFFLTPQCNTDNLNNHSMVTVFEYANSKIMIPGDNQSESWKELIKDTRFLTAARNLDVLVAPHHGRKEGYCPELFEAIGKPLITIVSDGPFCDTSATSSYGGQSRGWKVHYPDGSSEERNVVTTRQDGVIRVKAYVQDGKPYLIVNVQKGTAKKYLNALAARLAGL